MMKQPLLLFLCFLTLHSLQAQQSRTQDVLRLTNHWVLRGTILARTDSTIRIRTRDGNIFSFPIKQVESLTREPSWSAEPQSKSRWSSYTELGPLIAGRTNVNGVTTAAFSFQTLIGYSFSRRYTSDSIPDRPSSRPSFTPFLGIGADLYATQTILPLFASFRADLICRDTYTIFAFADAGYGLNITQNTSTPAGTNTPAGFGPVASVTTTYKGGLLYATGLGIRIPFNQRAGFLLSLGYRYQHTTLTTNDVPADVNYRRLALRAGFYL